MRVPRVGSTNKTIAAMIVITGMTRNIPTTMIVVMVSMRLSFVSLNGFVVVLGFMTTISELCQGIPKIL
jgi:hypothetical protein